jgi:hypothetical protein
MTSVLRGLAAEITPEWLTPKAVEDEPEPRKDPTDKPMPSATWKPEVEKLPRDPKENVGEFGKDYSETDESDSRHRLISKPE